MKRFAGLRRVFSLPRTARRLSAEVDDEIRFHIESHVGELIQQGIPEPEARRRALQRYGDVGQSREELLRVDRARAARQQRSAALAAFIQDLSYAARVFRSRPGFA